MCRLCNQAHQRSVCAFTWPPSVPPSLHPNLCRQLIGAIPKNIATPGPGNCSQVTGLSFFPPRVKPPLDLFWRTFQLQASVCSDSETRYVCVFYLYPGHQDLFIFLYFLSCTQYIWTMFIDLFSKGWDRGYPREFPRGRDESVNDNQKWT